MKQEQVRPPEESVAGLVRPGVPRHNVLNAKFPWVTGGLMKHEAKRSEDGAENVAICWR